MSSAKTTMAEPVHLAVPKLEPVPVEGCGTCEQLGDQRAEARAAGDLSAVSDCNVGIRRHPHGGRP
ncbi:hypothetical protein ACH3XX_26395 [Streptomyces scabiei]|uniref:hypothetical protein n=1 Tax=Streptomyces scabiei TaxID=1930 RepID=UPI00378EC851